MKKRKIKNSGYSSSGASRDKPALKSFLPQHYSSKSDIDANLELLRNRAADLVMNSALGSAAITTSAANVISSGLKLFPRIKPKELGLTPEQAVEWCRKTKQEFSLWAESLNCDYYRRNNFYELQRIAYVSYLTDGDCFCLFKRRYPTRDVPYTLRLQLIEAARISNPITNGNFLTASPFNIEMKNISNGNKIVNGIEVDKTGQFQAIWVSNRIWNEPSQDAELEYQRVKIFGSETGKRNVLHICNDSRTEQYRGVPFLSPVIESIKQVSRYADSELISAVIKSFFSIFFTQNINGNAYDLNQILPESDTDDALEKVMKEYRLGAGTITSLPRGVDVKAIDRSNAQSTFEPFISSFIKMIGAALNLPYEILLKNFQSSYSASRAAILQAETEFRQRRQAFIEDFLKPVYENFLMEAVALGRIEAAGFFEDALIRSLWLQADWINEGSHLLDVTKELQGAQMRIALGLSNRQTEAAQLCGLDFYDNLDQLAIEKKLVSDILPTETETSDDRQDIQ